MDKKIVPTLICQDSRAKHPLEGRKKSTARLPTSCYQKKSSKAMNSSKVSDRCYTIKTMSESIYCNQYGPFSEVGFEICSMFTVY